MTTLFSPIKFGAITAPNRIFMAPLTRCRADAEHVPDALMAEYYAQRASAGLIIAEATMAMEGNSAFWTEPGIYSAAQVAGWKLVTDAVHAAGGRIFLQIWHGGRACHPLLNDGAQPVAPSPIAITGDEVHTPEGKKPYVDPARAARRRTARHRRRIPQGRARTPRRPASTASRCTAPTATCSTSSCATAPTSAAAPTAARSKTARACCSK